MMTHGYQVIISWDQDEREFVAEVPELPGCVERGGSRGEAVARVETAIEAWIASARRTGRPVPEPALRSLARTQPPAQDGNGALGQQTVRLTRRELDVLYLVIVEGKSAEELADALCCRKRTVDFHLANIYKKLQVSNRTQAIHRAQQLGLLRYYGVV